MERSTTASKPAMAPKITLIRRHPRSTPPCLLMYLGGSRRSRLARRRHVYRRADGRLEATLGVGGPLEASPFPVWAEVNPRPGWLKRSIAASSVNIPEMSELGVCGVSGGGGMV